MSCIPRAPSTLRIYPLCFRLMFTNWLFPAGILDLQNSDQSSTLAANLARGSRSLPVISATATAPSLSDRSQYPTFMRTIPSDNVAAQVGAHGWRPKHDDVIKWKHFPRYWPFVRGIHRSPVNSPHKGQWRGALMLSLISAWINEWVNNRETGDLRRHHAHYDVTIMNKGGWELGMNHWQKRL